MAPPERSRPRIAARVAGRLQQYGGQFFGSSISASGPDTVTYPTVELFVNEAWTDITPYVYYRDMITIKRGRSSETAQLVEPAVCTMTLNNRDGRFSPRNPTGVYYGQVGRNTPIRVSVVRNGVRRYRFYGEVASWPVAWDLSGHDVYVSIEANGITRRLSQGTSPLRSPLYREMTNPTRTNIVAYWPCEDQSGSSSLASGVGGSAMTVTGTPTLSTYTGLQGSDALPTMGTATFTGLVSSYDTSAGETSFRAYSFIPVAGVASQQHLFDLYATGTAVLWRVLLETDGDLTLQAYDVDGTSLLNTRVNFNTDGELISTVLELDQNGANIDWNLFVENYSSASLITDTISRSLASGTVNSQTVGRVTQVTVGADGGLGDVAMGHVTLANALSAYGATGNAALGWRGENPTFRIQRLCREQAIDFQVVNHGITSGNFVAMGQQDPKAFLDLVSECVETDRDLLYEPRDRLGLNTRSRLSLYSQSAVLTLDHSQHQLSSPPIPVDDDRYTRNDVTVTRDHGSFDQEELSTGTLSVQDPPNGVGRYSTSVSISLSQDTLLPNQAYWRLHEGTVDEPRYPSITVNLRHSTFTDSVDMMNAALAVDVGDRLVVTNPPAWLPPEDITQVVIGYQEVLGILEHDIQFYCTPESIYHVPVTDDGTSRVDTAGSELTSAVDATTTSVSVTTTGIYPWVDSATYASDFPFDVMVGGERVTVTAITGTSSPQTFTVTRSVNGVVKSHVVGEAVNVVNQLYVGL